MISETVLTNARLALEDEIVSGSLLIRGDLIADISSTPAKKGDDMAGDFVIPGLVELHTDHLS